MEGWQAVPLPMGVARSKEVCDALDEAVHRVVAAAKSLEFGLYPAHGSGMVVRVTKGNGDMKEALAALQIVESQP